MPEEAEQCAGEQRPLHTILIVEDDTSIGTFLLEAIAGETPYHALLVASGPEALAALQLLTPHLLILDYHLPGIDGLRLYDLVHAMPGMRQIPAIMMSARLPQQELENRCIVGMNKPFELDDFLQRVKNILG
jgi:CheY-like chemotaxis protein